LQPLPLVAAQQAFPSYGAAVKRFSFPLQRVLEFRRQQEQAERLRLETLAVERARFLARAVELEAQSRDLRGECVRRQQISAVDLQQAYEYAQALGRHRELALEDATRAERQRRDQMARVFESRRRVQLLERWRARKLAQYAKRSDREQDALAMELHLGRLPRATEKNL